MITKDYWSTCTCRRMNLGWEGKSYIDYWYRLLRINWTTCRRMKLGWEDKRNIDYWYRLSRITKLSWGGGGGGGGGSPTESHGSSWITLDKNKNTHQLKSKQLFDVTMRNRMQTNCYIIDMFTIRNRYLSTINGSSSITLHKNKNTH